MAELYAITWLWDEGFEVFYNAGSTGAVDVVGIKDGEVYLFDVKMEGKNTNLRSRTPTQKKLALKSYSFKRSNTHGVTSGIGPSSKVKKTFFSETGIDHLKLGNRF